MRNVPLLAALAVVFTIVAPIRAQAPLRGPELAKAAAAAVATYTRFSIFDEVNIDVDNRDVTLTGRVTMPYKRDEIGKRVAKIDGVNNVENEIRVLPASTADGQLRVQIAQAIYMHPAFWQYASMTNPSIHIIVERRRVTLTGTVNSQVDRMLAYALAQVDGAIRVTNELQLDVK